MKPLVMSILKNILIGRNPKRTLVRLFLLIVIAVGIFGFVIRPATIRGSSMEPTVPSRGLRFINQLAYLREPPRRFDIVAISMAGNRMLYLKRVLGLPNERVAFQDGVLLINGIPVNEEYVTHGGNWTHDNVQLGEDEYYVAGDNRSASLESHVAGVTHRRFIEGRLM